MADFEISLKCTNLINWPCILMDDILAYEYSPYFMVSVGYALIQIHFQLAGNEPIHLFTMSEQYTYWCRFAARTGMAI